MTDTGPAWTIVRRGRDVYGRPWVQVRKRGGQETRVILPDRWATETDVRAAIEAAVARLPDRPGYWAV